MESLVTHRQSTDGEATVRIDPDVQSDQPVSPSLFGKFGEHLYMVGMDEEFNAKNAFEAQILRNPTFGSWKFQVHGNAVDGGRPATHDPDVISERVEGYADVHDLPSGDRMEEAYFDGTALWWFPVGDAEAIRTSPDVGTAGDRAQRLEVRQPDGPAGLAQWCYLPLHRTTGFEGKITVRGTAPASVTVAVHEVADDGAIRERLAETTVSAEAEFATAEFDLRLPADVDDSRDAIYACSVTTEETADLVVDRLLLYPDDHVHTADPEIVELLRDAELPLLRWPGGNFVSGYRWEDGVGPIEERPTKPNPAWDGLESNLFGTREFVEFCDAVGCEPMICLNAGDGTPEEAARWVEYCNGSTDTEMGALRAEHGHPEPYDVTYWEIGNELFGEWQVTWTTAEGNADRFQRFVDAMTDVDSSIEVLACGNRITDWNDPLLETAPEEIDWITDHVLVGGAVEPDVDTTELFNGYMGLAEHVIDDYADLEAKMEEHGVPNPRLAITELQFFSFLEDDDGDVEIPTSQSISEALYSATFVHEAIRSDGFVEMITHSGIGNHGGGIQKHKERVWAHPCQYYHGMGAALFDGTPLGIDLACDTFSTETTFAPDASKWTGELPPVSNAAVIDPMAVLTEDGDSIVVDLIHRDVTAGTLDVTVEIGDAFDAADEAELTLLSGESIRDENTFEDPENVTPSTTTVAVSDGTANVDLPPLTIARLTVSRA